MDRELPRSIVLDADAMGRLRKELVWTLGQARARAVLIRFGYAMGYAAAVTRRDAAEDDRAWLEGASAELAQSRLARIEVRDLAFDRATGSFSCLVDALDAFEVVEHSSHLGRGAAGTARSACWTLAGYLSGYLTAFLGGEVYFREESCALAGAPACRLEGRAAEQWPPDQAAELARLFEEENVGTELTVVYDELALKNAEMEQANAFLRAQQEATPDGILIVSLQGNVLSFNRRFLEVWGISEEQAARRCDGDFLQTVVDRVRHPRPFLAIIEALEAEPLATREGSVIEFTDGATVSQSTLPVLLGGKPIARAWYYRDITAQRRLEEQLRQAHKMEAVGALAGGVAHDFNNLLTAIGGYIELAAGELSPESDAASSLQTASLAVERACELTRGLLNFSRKNPAATAAVDLRGTIAETVQLLRRTIDPRITIEAAVDPDLSPALADAGQMTQVLTNLCLNARDAMPEGGRLVIHAGNIHITVPSGAPSAGSRRAGEFVCLRVRDTGQGVSPEVMARIFDPFFTTKEIGKGTGLGLSIVYGIIEQHSGFIECESSDGMGAEFRVYLPRAEAGQTSDPERPRRALAAGGRETVLLVDDESLVRDLSKTTLERLGYRVLTAGDGFEAIEVLRHHRADVRLVVLDLLMPRCSGWDAFHVLREISPDIPILIASGYSTHGQVETLLRLGAAGSVPKPFRPAELAARVREALLGAAVGVGAET